MRMCHPMFLFWPLAFKRRRMYWQFKLNLYILWNIYICRCFSNDHISATLFGQAYQNSLLLCLAGCICDLSKYDKWLVQSLRPQCHTGNGRWLVDYVLSTG
ncbi:hypothetical protein VPH35_038602 [Triticum aestivum]|uniref:Uncharacterized protein n=1 Tax=Aegilops tauschii subsp. strangulata TaxID=200361 RepID=A0A453CFS2_AEGTS